MTIPILIGELSVDFIMPTRSSGAKVRLGGVGHAGRALWATGQSYAVGAFCPPYLANNAKKYLVEHGCERFILLGDVLESPNVIAVGDVKEISHQGYEDILGENKSILYTVPDMDGRLFDRAVIFPGAYDIKKVIGWLDSSCRVTIDAAYDIDAETLAALKGRIDRLVISTSSDLFAELAQNDVGPLLRLSKSIDARYLLLKENRGGSRLFDMLDGSVEYIAASLGETVNSVGVGDAFTAVFGTIDGSAADAGWRGMQVATAYSQTTWPDDLRRDVGREFKIKIETVRSLGGVTLPWHARPQLQIYLASPDFSYKNHIEIDCVVSSLTYHNFRVRRPVKENGEANPNSEPRHLAAYFSSDVSLLRDCAAVFAIPIERDPGTLIEIGLAIEMGKPVITYDPRNENRNTMVMMGSRVYSSDLDICLNGLFEALASVARGNPG